MPALILDHMVSINKVVTRQPISFGVDHVSQMPASVKIAQQVVTAPGAQRMSPVHLLSPVTLAPTTPMRSEDMSSTVMLALLASLVLVWARPTTLTPVCQVRTYATLTHFRKAYRALLNRNLVSFHVVYGYHASVILDLLVIGHS